ncbi:MAG: hypothetical protein VYD71_01170 [Bacteroidota bacterium]|nr:hypothetical protein [Bacteroidota bacterium]
MKKIICLWSCPRNVSTALMYSFAQRSDTLVFDEPLYAHYLKVSCADHPGKEEVLNTQEYDGEKVVDQIILKQRDKITFHKLMTHFLTAINLDFLSKVSNIIFIRNPEEIIASYSKVILDPKMEDIGIEKQYELYHHLIEIGENPIVLDSKYLLKDPKLILQQLCLELEIEFDEEMLQWEQGAREEDGIWAKYWYANVHNSTGFFSDKKIEISLRGSNASLAKECLPFYEFLTDKSIKI